MFQHILVPLDGSKSAEKALDLALDMARCYGGELTLLQVQDEGLDVGAAAVARATELASGSALQASKMMQQQCEAYLRGAMQARQETGVKMAAVVSSGDAPTSILQVVEEKGIDLIVMATHGRTGLRRLAFGSVTEDVLHKATCPVVVIRPPDYE